MESRARTGSSDSQVRLTQAERSARTERRLLAAALELIAERGYGASSLAAIGARAGYSRGVVSHAFGSKGGLLAALVETMHARWDHTQLQPAVGDRRGAEALCAAIDAVRRQADEHPVEVRALYTLLFEALGPTPELRPRFAALHTRVRRGVERWIRAGLEHGEVDPEVDPAAQATLFVAAFRGTMYQWLLDPEHVDLERVFAEQKRAIRRALAPRANDAPDSNGGTP